MAAYADSDWRRYEPKAVRDALPLEWAVGYLFGAWGVGAAMAPCPLPGHEDSTASFNLWAENQDGYPVRFGCFGCGANGDVIDLIRIARGVGFLEACAIAIDELVPYMVAAGWSPAERTAEIRKAATEEDLYSTLMRLQRTTAHEQLLVFMERKGMEDARDYAFDEWRWRAARIPAPIIYFPHWDAESRLTGIRYRSARREGTRWAEVGSRFPALYGSWRDEQYPSVLLCEGETDTVAAAWQLHTDAHTVLGLPAGAAQKPSTQAVAQLRMRTVTLAFDGDIAGRIATERWRSALNDAGCVVRVAPIPDGEDLLSSGVAARDLIAMAS